MKHEIIIDLYYTTFSELKYHYIFLNNNIGLVVKYVTNGFMFMIVNDDRGIKWFEDIHL